MKGLDHLLRRWRFAKALPWVRPGDRLLDLGCYDRAFIERARPTVSRAVGLDPRVEPERDGSLELVRGSCPGDPRFDSGCFDCITMLAVLEHITEVHELARECARMLAARGRLVITVPRPAVDRVLAVLRFLRLVHGMCLDEHHGYDVGQTRAIFEGAGLRLVRRRSFQLGLNCLFVFEKPASIADDGAGTSGARTP